MIPFTKKFRKIRLKLSHQSNYHRPENSQLSDLGQFLQHFASYHLQYSMETGAF